MPTKYPAIKTLVKIEIAICPKGKESIRKAIPEKINLLRIKKTL